MIQCQSISIQKQIKVEAFLPTANRRGSPLEGPPIIINMIPGYLLAKYESLIPLVEILKNFIYDL